jgi:raffinose/stachyose/melibiose transport system permease protein/N-acetylglucosamine transport system permease protein
MKSNKFLFRRFASHTILIIWSISVGMLLYFIIISSFKTNRTVFRQLWSLPEKLNLSNFQNAWSNLNFGRYTFNSIFVVISAVALIIIISAPASYALTRMKMRFAQPMTFFYLAGMGVPAQLLLIPLFKIMASLNLVDTLPGLIIVYTALSIPFTVLLLTGFFLSIPSELEDAAHIDGCNEFQTFLKIMVPMATPGIVTAGIFNFTALWNEYMLALVFTTGTENRTLPLGLYSLYSALQYTSDWVTIFAASFLTIIPTIILFIFLSEKLISGITLGAIK